MSSASGTATVQASPGSRWIRCRFSTPAPGPIHATAADWLPHSPFTGVAESLRRDPGWDVTDLDSSHNLLANGPHDLLKIILDMAL